MQLQTIAYLLIIIVQKIIYGMIYDSIYGDKVSIRLGIEIRRMLNDLKD